MRQAVREALTIEEKIRSGSKLDVEEKGVFANRVNWVLVQFGSFGMPVGSRVADSVSARLLQAVMAGETLSGAAWAVVLHGVFPKPDDFDRVMAMALEECSDKGEGLTNEKLLSIGRRDRLVRRMTQGF